MSTKIGISYLLVLTLGSLALFLSVHNASYAELSFESIDVGIVQEARSQSTLLDTEDLRNSSRITPVYPGFISFCRGFRDLAMSVSFSELGRLSMHSPANFDNSKCTFLLQIENHRQANIVSSLLILGDLHTPKIEKKNCFKSVFPTNLRENCTHIPTLSFQQELCGTNITVTTYDIPPWSVKCSLTGWDVMQEFYDFDYYWGSLIFGIILVLWIVCGFSRETLVKD